MWVLENIFQICWSLFGKMLFWMFSENFKEQTDDGLRSQES